MLTSFFVNLFLRKKNIYLFIFSFLSSMQICFFHVKFETGSSLSFQTRTAVETDVNNMKLGKIKKHDLVMSDKHTTLHKLFQQRANTMLYIDADKY